MKECLSSKGKFSHLGWEKVENYEPNISDLGKARNKKDFLSIAHPNFTFKNFDETIEFIEKYKNILNGIEINSLATKNRVNFIIEIAKKYNLILTFGSDSHFDGITKYHGELGELNKNLNPNIIRKNFGDFKDFIK